MNSLYTLKNDTLFFAKLSRSEVPMIHEYASNKSTSRYIGWALKETPKETEEYIEELLQREERGSHMYASVYLHGSEKQIGTVMIFNFNHLAKHAEIGYVLHQDYWGKGLGTQIVHLLKTYCFEVLQMHKIYGTVVSANKSSQRILEKNGFSQEACLKDHFLIDETYYHSHILSCFQ